MKRDDLTPLLTLIGRTSGAHSPRAGAMDARFSRELRRQAALAFVFGAYGLTFYLGVDAWREQDQFFVERDPQLSYPANPSTVPTSSFSP